MNWTNITLISLPYYRCDTTKVAICLIKFVSVKVVSSIVMILFIGYKLSWNDYGKRMEINLNEKRYFPNPSMDTLTTNLSAAFMFIKFHQSSNTVNNIS